MGGRPSSSSSSLAAAGGVEPGRCASVLRTPPLPNSCATRKTCASSTPKLSRVDVTSGRGVRRACGGGAPDLAPRILLRSRWRSSSRVAGVPSIPACATPPSPRDLASRVTAWTRRAYDVAIDFGASRVNGRWPSACASSGRARSFRAPSNLPPPRPSSHPPAHQPRWKNASVFARSAAIWMSVSTRGGSRALMDTIVS